MINEIFENNIPMIIEYITEGLTTVSPKLEYNSPIYNPSPKLDEKELKESLNYIEGE